jgi:hypothetical protein
MPLQKQTTNPDDKNHQETKFRMQNKQTWKNAQTLLANALAKANL